ncbi:MAG: prepilin-type N-terminal cleavage/methylation domain-containing protein [Eubacteriales bacterium]
MLNNKGFSLIELVIVIAILAVLAGIGMFVYNTVIDRARYCELCADVRIYEIAAQSAIVDLGAPENTVVWGDSVAEADEWTETNWLSEKIDDGILVTISNTSEVNISFLETSENYDDYMELVEKFGE